MINVYQTFNDTFIRRPIVRIQRQCIYNLFFSSRVLNFQHNLCAFVNWFVFYWSSNDSAIKISPYSAATLSTWVTTIGILEFYKMVCWLQIGNNFVFFSRKFLKEGKSVKIRKYRKESGRIHQKNQTRFWRKKSQNIKILAIQKRYWKQYNFDGMTYLVWMTNYE